MRQGNELRIGDSVRLLGGADILGTIEKIEYRSVGQVALVNSRWIFTGMLIAGE